MPTWRVIKMVKRRLECELILSGYICSRMQRQRSCQQWQKVWDFFALLFWNQIQLEFNIPHTSYQLTQLTFNTPTKIHSNVVRNLVSRCLKIIEVCKMQMVCVIWGLLSHRISSGRRKITFHSCYNLSTASTALR